MRGILEAAAATAILAFIYRNGWWGVVQLAIVAVVAVALIGWLG